MKDVYIKNPQMGDAASVDHRLAELGQNIEKLRLEVQKFEVNSIKIQLKKIVKSCSGLSRSFLAFPDVLVHFGVWGQELHELFCINWGLGADLCHMSIHHLLGLPAHC